MDIDADAVSEHHYLPEAHTLRGSLLLIDSGFVNKPYFHELDEHKASYIVKGRGNLTPTIAQAFNGKGKALKRPIGKRLKQISQKKNSQKVMDFDVKWEDDQCRLIRCWVASEQKVCAYYKKSHCHSSSQCRYQVYSSASSNCT